MAGGWAMPHNFESHAGLLLLFKNILPSKNSLSSGNKMKKQGDRARGRWRKTKAKTEKKKQA